MPSVDTVLLVSELRKRADDIDSPGFLDAYELFVRSVLAGSPDATAYRDWIDAKISKQGVYVGCRTPEQVDRRLRFGAALIRNVAHRGVKRPIILSADQWGVQIDGWHRTVISMVCGFARVPCLNRGCTGDLLRRIGYTE